MYLAAYDVMLSHTKSLVKPTNEKKYDTSYFIMLTDSIELSIGKNNMWWWKCHLRQQQKRLHYPESIKMVEWVTMEQINAP